MSQRNTLIRSLHDLGAAAWFGGGLMGAVGLNGAAAEARDPQERLRLSSLGWKKWAPVQLGAIVAHGIGGLGLIFANKSRLATQGEGRANTIVKSVLTVAALGTTFYSAVLGRQMDERQHEGAEGTTEPHGGASDELASAQRQQRLFQWLTPAIVLVLIVLGAQQGEQQRPFAGLLSRIGVRSN